MNLTITDSDWTLIPVAGDKQVTNIGNTSVRIIQQATKPTNAQDGLILSTYAQPYATSFIGGMTNVYVLPIGGNGTINIESV